MWNAPGPVFTYEWLRISRRWTFYASRSLWIAAVLLGLGLIPGEAWRRDPLATAAESAAIGQGVYAVVVVVEMTMILFAAPAATAGAICLDRSRGALALLMATPLADAEIVVGKLAAALLPVLLTIFSALPVLMLSTLLGGIDPLVLIASFATMTATAVFTCTLAFTLSAWGNRPHEVLGATYLILATWIGLLPALGSALAPGLNPSGLLATAFDLAQATNPYLLLFPAFDAPPTEHLKKAAIHAAAGLGLASLLIAACIRSIRPLTQRNRPQRRPRPPRFRLPSPTFSFLLDADPILWREWKRSRPSGWGRFVATLYGLIAVVLTALGVLESLGGPLNVAGLAFLADQYVVVLGLLILSVRACTSLTEERTRGTLDVLLSTPLSTSSILVGKWWGALRTAWPIVLLPGLTAIVPVAQTGRWLPLGAFLALLASHAMLTTSIGLTVAVWVARQGRAVGFCVTLFLAACLGWPILSVTIGSGLNRSGLFLLGSPIAVAGLPTFSWTEPSGADEVTQTAIECLVWGFLQAVSAILLLGFACESFDARLGRIHDRPAHADRWRTRLARIPFRITRS